MGYKVKILSAEDIKKSVKMDEAINVVGEAFKQLSEGEANVPERIHLEIPEYKTTSLIMSAYLPQNKKIGLKIINLCDDNPLKNLPLAHAVIILSNAENGIPLAIMDGSYLTALRTGAASGIATKILSREDSEIVAIFGAGIQGRKQLEAVCCVRPIKKAYIFEINYERAKSFKEEMSKKLSMEIEIAESEEVLLNVDIICTATTSKNPVFNDKNIKEGVHINAIGSYKPHVREIPGETVSRAKVVVDNYESCLKEAGDLIIPIKEKLINRKHIYAEIGEIIAGLKQGRASEKEITFFKSVGNAVQDVAVASLALKNSLNKNLGIEITL